MFPLLVVSFLIDIIDWSSVILFIFSAKFDVDTRIELLLLLSGDAAVVFDCEGCIVGDKEKADTGYTFLEILD